MGLKSMWGLVSPSSAKEGDQRLLDYGRVVGAGGFSFLLLKKTITVAITKRIRGEHLDITTMVIIPQVLVRGKLKLT